MSKHRAPVDEPAAAAAPAYWSGWDSLCLTFLVGATLSALDNLTRAVRANTAVRRDALDLIASVPDVVRNLPTAPKE